MPDDDMTWVYREGVKAGRLDVLKDLIEEARREDPPEPQPGFWARVLAWLEGKR